MLSRILVLLVVLTATSYSEEQWNFSGTVINGYSIATNDGSAAINLPGFKNPYAVGVAGDGKIWAGTYYSRRLENTDGLPDLDRYPDLWYEINGIDTTEVWNIPIWVFDPSDGTIDTIRFMDFTNGTQDTLFSHRGMARSYDGNMIVATKESVYKVNCQTYEVIAKWTAPEESQPLQTLTCDADGFVYTMSLWGGIVYILDPDDLSEYSQITSATTSISRGSAVSTDGHDIYISMLQEGGAIHYHSDFGPDGVYSLIDTVGQAVIASGTAFWDPSGYLWLSTVIDQGNKMWSFDPGNNYAVVDSTSFSYPSPADTTIYGYPAPEFIRCPRDGAFNLAGDKMYLADFYSYSIKEFQRQNGVLVTFLANTCGVPDTLHEYSTVQLRGNLDVLGQWTNDSQVFMDNIEGDYWSTSIFIDSTIAADQVINYKYCTDPRRRVDIVDPWYGWEMGGDWSLDLSSFTGTDTTLELQYVRGWADVEPEAVPFSANNPDSIYVYLRVNMQAARENGLFDPTLDLVGVRGTVGETMNWGETMELNQESSHANGEVGSDYDGTNFYSRLILVPGYFSGNVEYKFVFHDASDGGYVNWEGDVGPGNRHFVLPAEGDTTIHWVWWDNQPPQNGTGNQQILYVATWGDDNSGDGSEGNPFASIQKGIDVAIDSDTVMVQQGAYYENINYNGKNITVASNYINSSDWSDVEQTIIDGQQQGHVVLIENGETSQATLNGFTITNGRSGFGGGISCQNNSSPVLLNLIIAYNAADTSGGGISCYLNSNPTITNVWIHDNHAGLLTAGSAGGLSAVIGSAPVVSNCQIWNNSSTLNGGGVRVHDGGINLTNCEIYSNNAVYGAGICIINSSSEAVDVSSCIVHDNFGEEGAGISIRQSNVVINGLVIENNQASNNGGGIQISENASLSTHDSQVTGNHAESLGGGIYIDSSYVSFFGGSIGANTAVSGGGIMAGNNSNLIINNVQVTDNVVDSYDGGGGLRMLQGDVYIDNSYFARNTSTGWGGAINVTNQDSVNAHTVNISNTVIEENYAADGAALDLWTYTNTPNTLYGEVNNCIIIRNSGLRRISSITGTNTNINFQDCRVSENTAENYGAGLHYYDNIYCRISHTLINNNVVTNGPGSGIYFRGGSMLDVQFCTITENSASEGDALILSGGQGSIVNTIIWNNGNRPVAVTELAGTPGQLVIEYSDIQFDLDSLQIEGSSGVDWLEGNIDAEPLFVDPSVSDFSLQIGSPCIDAGHPDLNGDGFTWETDPDDQDPDGTRMDMGSYPYSQGQSNRYSLIFENSTSRLDIPHSNSLDYSGTDLTMEVWVKVSNFNQIDNYWIICKQDIEGIRSYGFYINQDGEVCASIHTSNGHLEEPLTVAGSIIEHIWQHVAVTYNGNFAMVFIDGQLSGQMEWHGDILSCSNELNIGYTWWSGDVGDHHYGLLDELRLSSVVRYSTDFQPNYYNYPDSFTMGLWHFDEGEGDNVFDLSGNGNTGQISDVDWSTDVPDPTVGNDIIYVATWGDAAGDGTESNPYRTIQHGIDVAVPGAEIRVATGLYSDSIYVNNKSLFILGVEGPENTIISTNNTDIAAITLYDNPSPVIFEGFSISSNHRIGNEGSAFEISSSVFQLNNCWLIDNTSESIDEWSGVMTISGAEHSESYINNCLFAGNSNRNEGAVFRVEDQALHISSSVIVDNSEWAFHINSTDIDITNCTISNNDYGLLLNTSSVARVYNSIFYNNSPAEIDIDNSAIDIQFSDIKGYSNGAGVIDSPPMFMDPDSGDYNLQFGSPCIDTGDPDLDGDGETWETDPDDQDPDGTRMDMGAYYFDQSSGGETTTASINPGSGSWLAQTDTIWIEFSRPVNLDIVAYHCELTSTHFGDFGYHVGQSSDQRYFIIPTDSYPFMDLILLNFVEGIHDDLGNPVDISAISDSEFYTSLPADYNNDSIVDYLDFTTFVDLWFSDDIYLITQMDLYPRMGELPNITVQSDGTFGYDELMTLVYMWNWSHQETGRLARTPVEFMGESPSFEQDGSQVLMTMPEAAEAGQLIISYQPDAVQINKTAVNHSEDYLVLQDKDAEGGELLIEYVNLKNNPKNLITLDTRALKRSNFTLQIEYSFLSDENHLIGQGKQLFDLVAIPNQFALHQNYPNPFNPVTTIEYDLPDDGLVKLTIIDILGRQVIQLTNEYQTAGYKSVSWNGRNTIGKTASTGIYFYILESGKYSDIRKLVILK